MAFAIVSGARDSAIATLKLKHVDVERRRIVQNPQDGVRTKNSKTITSAFFPVGQELESVIGEWIAFLQSEKGFSGDDPLFPATKVEVGLSGHFEQTGLSRDPWKSATAIRRIFKGAFTAGNLPYFNPHSFRSTLAVLGTQVCKSPEEFKAWSQNLSHESVLTTFNSYGNVSQSRQDAILLQMSPSSVAPSSQHSHILSAADRLERIERMLTKLTGSAAD